MLINCPRCNAVYNVTSDKLQKNTKKFRCAECGTVWEPVLSESISDDSAIHTIKTPNVKPQQIKISTTNDIDEMFNRLSQDTKGLFSDNNLNQEDKRFFSILSRKLQVIFNPTMTVCCLLFIIFIFTFLIGYINRYEIVTLVPKMETFYNKIGIESLYSGKDIIFRNVKIKPIQYNNKHFIEIVGTLYNSGTHTVKLLPIKAQVVNNLGLIENEEKLMLQAKHLDSQFSSIFRIVMENKYENIHKIILTMEK